MIGSVFLLLNLGGSELFLIVIVVIMLFGQDKLPELMKGIGKGIREINDAKNQIQNEIQKSTSGIKEDFKKQTLEMQSEIEKAGQSVKRSVNGVNESLKNNVPVEPIAPDDKNIDIAEKVNS